jgi:hopanoid biosynthesis associated RND transporter like protein HpnN
MLNSTIVRVVDFCARHCWMVVLTGLALAVATAAYDVRHFSITTDIEALISQTLPWHQRQLALAKDFAQRGIIAVVTASTPENAEQATSALSAELARHPDLFPSVGQPDSGDFFKRNGLLFQSLPEVKQSVRGLIQGKPLIGQLAYDPSLRGVMKTLSAVADGTSRGPLKLDQLVRPLALAENTLNDVLAGKPAAFSWQELLQDHPTEAAQLRHFIEIQPKLDFTALQPGLRATEAIRRTAADLKLGEAQGARVQLTGQVPMNDDLFSVIQQSALRDTLIAFLGVLIVLWLALRSWRITAAVLLALMVGLAVTAALGLAMVGSFNLISVAFFVLFIGLGVDFGIQFSVRYRAERHEQPDLRRALQCAARKAATPLALAAAATAVGFLAFLPTSYNGLSELGLIAGSGMLIAFLCSITLVPAALAALQPPVEADAVGFTWLAPLDDFMQRHRIAIIAVTLVPVLAAAPLLFRLPFDFNLINLQDPASPSVVAYRELQQYPQTNANDAEVVAPSLDQANDIARRLTALPEVAGTLTLSSFIPADQPQKIAAIKAAQQALGKTLAPPQTAAAPSDQDVVAALRAAAADLGKAAGQSGGAGAAAARQVSGLLQRLADADPAVRAAAATAIVSPLIADLDQLRKSLEPQPVTLKTLPANVVRDWTLPDGRARVQAVPKGDAQDGEMLRQFAVAVLKAEPSATGPAISYYESGRTITRAFVEAGLLAFAAIAILLFIVLRRVVDVMLTLVPLLIAGAVTLEICALSGFALNFANIIALPLLLGVGVAFKIYYIMAWRAGKTGLLQSTLTRAVVFSAMTNAIAFGSMWSSDYPSMSSMGKLMFLALTCTMAAAVFFQPVLMGRPRQIEQHAEDEMLREAAE